MATTVAGSIPGPGFLAFILIIFVVIGMEVEPAQPIVIFLLVLIMAGLLLEGYGQIHTFITGFTGTSGTSGGGGALKMQ